MAQNPIVTFEMANGGVFKAELYPEIAPNTVTLFITCGILQVVGAGSYVNKQTIQQGDLCATIYS